ncbi:MAG: FeoB-associated Cys-rich membrane protein [Oscillospiraceae bacterium]|nr:FeoB-associated Cys-rich membrane protein [Oscillospiraceae bacterium]
MENAIIIVVVLMVIGLAVRFIYKEKKRGVKCVGCPFSETCGSGGCNGGCSCGNGQSK